MIFFAGVCLGFAVGVIIFLVLAKTHKPDNYDWLKTSWETKIDLIAEQNDLLEKIVDAIENKKGRGR